MRKDLSRPKPRHASLVPVFLGGLVVVVIIGAAIFFGVASSFMNEQTQTCTITDKDRTNSTDSDGATSSNMRIYTEQCDVLQIEDMPLRGIWDSASIYGKLQPGETYEITTVWYRVPFMSWFPSIIEVR